MSIYALSSGPGISGVAVIRVAGGNVKKVIKLFMKPLANIYYAKSDTVVYFLNTIDGIDEVNTGHLGNEGAYYPINALTGEFVFLQKTDQLSWGDKCFNLRRI